MYELLCLKFGDKELLEKLIDTYPHELVEGNYWHDTFWGQCNCTKHQGDGENVLGSLLMFVRNTMIIIKKESDE